MKQYQYCYYNVLAGFYGKPFIDNLEPQTFFAGYQQGLFAAPIDVLESLKEVDLYLVAEFDNVTGDVSAKKEFIGHIGEVVATILAKKAANVPGDTNERKEN